MRGSRLLGLSLVAACSSGPTRPELDSDPGSTSSSRPTDGGRDTAAAASDNPAASGGASEAESTSQGGSSGSASSSGETGTVPPVSPGREFDLDGDGVADSDLAIGSCPDDASSTCLIVDSDVTDVDAVELWAGGAACTATLTGRPIAVVGDHAGSELAEVYAAGCINDGVSAPGSVAVVDVDGALVLGQTTAPAAQSGGFVDAAAGPDGRRHPILAPSYGDGGVPEQTWGQLCAYRPELGATGACGEGFSPVTVAVPAPVFREVGGTLQDLDGDGWEDVNLIYHRTVHTISIATLASIATTTFDVAAASEPGAPTWFHSGRNYGTHSAYSTTSERLLIVGGAPVGTFSDVLCNVSFFIAMLDAPPGNPAARSLAWSRYQGFSSTVFDTYSAQYVGNESADVARLASVVDGCVHRFSGSRTEVDGAAAILVNYFAMDAPVDYCLEEQFALYQPPAWTDDKAMAWYDCFGENIGATGVWGMQVLRESDGLGITGSQGTYVWGWSSTLLPSGERVYVVEDVAGAGRFDLSDRAPSALRIWALQGGLWQPRGTAPVAGRPRILRTTPHGSDGLGSSSYFAELSLEDRNGDGTAEFALEDGTWIGWDPAADDFAVVP